MHKTLDKKKQKIKQILENNTFIDVLDKKVNNSGNIFVSNSKKEGKNVRGYRAIVIILPPEA